MSLQPINVTVPSFLLDSRGNGTSPAFTPTPTLYKAVKLIASVAGLSPQWTVNVSKQSAAFPRGAFVDAPLPILMPNDVLTISVAGGAPGSQVTGMLAGVASDQVSDVLPFLSLGANTLDVSTSQPSVSLGFFIVPAGQLQTSGLIQTGGAQAVGFTVTVGSLFEVIMAGATTGVNYLDIRGPSTQGPFIAPVPAVLDTAVQFTVDNTAGTGPAVIEMFAYFAPVSYVPRDTVLNPQGWQAAVTYFSFAFALNAGASLLVIGTPLSTSTVFVHDLNYIVNTLVANSFLNWIEDGTGKAITADGTDTVSGIRPWHFSGARLTQGNGLKANNPGGAAGPNIRGHVTWASHGV